MNKIPKCIYPAIILNVIFSTMIFADAVTPLQCEFSAKDTGAVWNTKKLKIPGAKWQLNYTKDNIEIIKDTQKGDVIKLNGIKPEYQEVTLLDNKFVKKYASNGKLVLEMEFKPVETIAGKMFFQVYCIVSSMSYPGKCFVVNLYFFSDKIVCNRKKAVKADLLDRWSHVKIMINTKTNTWTVELNGEKIAVNKERVRKSKYSYRIWFGDGSQICAGVVLVNKVIVRNN